MRFNDNYLKIGMQFLFFVVFLKNNIVMMKLVVESSLHSDPVSMVIKRYKDTKIVGTNKC